MTMRFKQLKVLFSVAAMLGASGATYAKATPEELAKLGKELTCMGAEKAGSASGVAEFTGKWLGAGPGMTAEIGKHPTDPYASEKAQFTITAQNMAQYGDKLSEGQKAMFKKYPNTFKMHVFPSHRDFRYDDSVCKVVAKNGAETEPSADGKRMNNYNMGAIPFPFPKSGNEAIWNGTFTTLVNVEFRDEDAAVVYPNGNITWGQQLMAQYCRRNDPKLRGQKAEGTAVYVRMVTIMPERNKGEVVKTMDNFTQEADARLAWQYIPAVRRVRQAPGFGFDSPIPSTSNTVVVDEVRMYNGSAERYNWKLVGKKEMYIPYNNFRLEAKDIGANKYANLLKPGHENPDFVRWELHRVYVLEGKLKEGYRHLYPTRVVYADEDSWLFVMSDIYDGQNNLWRYNWVNNFYAPGPKLFAQGSAFYHDLTAGTYTAFDLMQGKPQHLAIDKPGADYGNVDFYSNDNMKASGY
ncbi:MAG: DUF1329 domain-containing protein [Sterolibacterium sp.]|nr:DUF1329 domain-containing protein [Sterolibacterium sp.]